MLSESVKKKWHERKNRILFDWIDFLYVLHILVKNLLLAISFNFFLLFIGAVINIHGQQWYSEVITYIDEICSILMFVVLTVIELYEFLKIRFLDTRKHFLKRGRASRSRPIPALIRCQYHPDLCLHSPCPHLSAPHETSFHRS